MNVLSAEKLTRITGDEKVLFRDLNFGIGKGQKIALVGINGCGKSTLMKTLAGLEPPDGGIVSLRKGIRAGYLPQDPDFPAEKTILEAVLELDNPATVAVRNYELALMEGADPKSLESAMAEMDRENAWDLEARLKKILGQLGIQRFEAKTGELSGGQKKRVGLAALLIAAPDLMMLDEPTNHLDLEMVEWLEEYLIDFQGSILMVTHDRYFLDRVADSIVELEAGQLYTYEGNYAYFLEKKAERELNAQVTADKAKNLYRTELEWLRRQPKARTTKSQARIDAASILKEKAQAPEEKEKIRLEVKMARAGNTILEMEKVDFAYPGKKILDHFTYFFRKKDRIGIVGPNGTGKTTFLEIATGRKDPQSGTVKIGQNTVFGYYRQEGLTWKPGQKALDVVKDVAEHFTLASGENISASQFMNMFLFPPQLQYTPVEKLSGGEKKRLSLLKVLVKNPNFLILDEPTNDLDLITLTALEEFLVNYPGCLMIVSHDRFFMDKLAEHLFVFEGEGKIRDFPGKYSDYRIVKAAEDAEAEVKAKDAVNRESEAKKSGIKTGSGEKKKLSYKETQEFHSLGKEIPEIETKISQLEAFLSSGSGDYRELSEKGEELEKLKQALDEKSMRWLELGEWMV